MIFFENIALEECPDFLLGFAYKTINFDSISLVSPLLDSGRLVSAAHRCAELG